MSKFGIAEWNQVGPMTIPSANDVDTVRSLMELVSNYYPLVQTPTDLCQIPYFGGVARERRLTRGGEIDFVPLYRNQGWAVALTRTVDQHFLLLIQPKPGALAPCLEFPAGGVGANPDHPLTAPEVLERTLDHLLIETGYAGAPQYLGFSIVETGKMYDPSVKEADMLPGSGRGVKAHLVFVDQAHQISEPNPATTDIIQPIAVTPDVLRELVRDNVLTETSAVNAYTLAFLRGLI